MEYNARVRYELHQAVIEWVGNVMAQNDIPAYIMEDALNDALYRVREISFQEQLRKFIADAAAEKELAEQETQETSE